MAKAVTFPLPGPLPLAGEGVQGVASRPGDHRLKIQRISVSIADTRRLLVIGK